MVRGRSGSPARPQARTKASSPPGASRTAKNGTGRPVGFQNSATDADLDLYVARSYSLMRPPRMGRLCVPKTYATRRYS